MRLWMPTLLLLALGAYLLPESVVSNRSSAPPVIAVSEDPLFLSTRSAVIRIHAADPSTQQLGLGTGFFINKEGDIITAYHVVAGKQLFQIVTLTGQRFPARLVGFDATQDLALLRPEYSQTFPALPLSEQPLMIGTKVLAIGNSSGDFLQPRYGHLIAQQAAAARTDFPQDTLELSIPLAPGDSGGPVMNEDGKVLGVVSYIRQRSDGTTARSFAVPLSKSKIQSLQNGTQREQIKLGIILDLVHNGTTQPTGAVIQRVIAGSPAAKAGLRGCRMENGIISGLGDIILSVNGVPVQDAQSFLKQVFAAHGDRISLEYFREGQRHHTELLLRTDHLIESHSVCDETLH